ncbi:type III-B CRISPR module RAMP protein Cmr4 [Archaeoglobus neptunius]|uniref:type III-B CRISPR module RAMP protein Cmr4 n=1 Tax=Archaeoglobus neptunius TaxID=2798580 RepID=UPI001925F76E|nr:type III-B CRISPR module RAMP protein Cmr4 [Archaeoglobus neptunius]
MSDCGNKVYEQKKYFAIALDPIHIGTGGYRIGRVDNTIVREPATGIPKIPGTTIEGVCRSYAFLRIMENGKLREELKKSGFNQQCAKGKVKKEGDRKIEPCGKCPVCITFGYTTDTRSLQAMALFSDARVLFFPVATMIGPVWVTCPMILKDAGIKDIPKLGDNSFIVPEGCEIKPPDGKLNFGWLLLNQDNKDSNKETNVDNWVYSEDDDQKKKLKDAIREEILKRITIVSDNLFATIVNSNLEVRTSVAIDPERGAAEEGALFTYEAIPRGTVFWFDVTYQNPRFYQIDSINGCNNTDLKRCIIETVKSGLSLFECLGLGGMSSRGFGRLRVLNLGDDDGNKK